MDAKVISKDKIPTLLDDLIERFHVWAPMAKDDLFLFDRLVSGSEARLDVVNTKLSPKKAFFPQSEILLAFDRMRIEEPPAPEDLVLFGVRPCDAASLLVLDKVFRTSEFPNPYYSRRREATCLVGIGCNTPVQTCFCTDVGGGPFHTPGLDVLLSDLGDRYLMEFLTEKGEQLLGDTPSVERARD